MAAIVKLFVSVLALAWISTQALASPLLLPRSEVGVVAGHLVLADLKCELVNGKLVCGTTKDHKNRDDDDDDDDDDDNHHHKDKDKDKATSQADCKQGTCFACGGCFPRVQLPQGLLRRPEAAERFQGQKEGQA